MKKRGSLDSWRIAHCMKVRDLFITFNEKHIQAMYGYDIKKDMKANSIISFVYKLFRTALSIVVDDIIENGIQFDFTSSFRGDVTMYMDCVNGERFRELKKEGYLKAFDPVKTNFTAYGIMINVKRAKGRTMQKLVHLDATRNARIVEKAENGGIKCGKVKHYKDYYEDIHKIYPFLKVEDIYPILRFGFNSLARHLLYGLDVLVATGSDFFMTGMVFKNEIMMEDYVRSKFKRKIVVMYRKLHYLWDGYAYFLVNKKKYDEIKDDFEKGKEVDFGEVRMFRVYDMAVAWADKDKFLFKVKDDSLKSKYMHTKMLKTSEAEFVEEIEEYMKDAIANNKRPWLTKFNSTKNLRSLYKVNKKEYANKMPHKRNRKFSEEEEDNE